MEKEVNGQITFIVGIIILAIVVFIGAYYFQAYKETRLTDSLGLSELNFTSLSSNTLSPIDNGITSESVKVLNDTFLYCDGINDYIRITPSSNDTLSFYYNSSTSIQCQFVVNVMGVKYTNGSLGNPEEYPVYWDDPYYYFCKTDSTTFWAGYIDKISIYDGQLNNEEISELNNQTRW